jgi:ABC-type lipoprotein export system ATPase subunit
LTAPCSIELLGVEFRYPRGEFGMRIEALQIAAGERVACIGPSGTGKTTLVNLIAGIALPLAGSVRVDGTELSRLSDRDRRAFRIARIGMLFQQLELFEYLDVLDNILLPYHVAAELKLTPEHRERAAALAAALGLSRMLRRRPHELSQGERQRVALCRALATEPGLLLCDEPTGNLDPRTAATALDRLFAAAADRQATLLMVTHDHGILPRFDRVVDMERLAAPA